MKILSLDIALNCGWAFGDPDNIEVGTKCFAGIKDYAIVGRLFRKWLQEKIEETKPDHIVLEQPFFHWARHGQDYLLNGMAWEANRTAELLDLPRFEYSPRSVKKFVTDFGNASKSQMVQAITDKGYKVKTDHEADAVGLLLLHWSKKGLS